ncbi:hypothetical protein [Archangium violaceum]|uniref:hypothetical protein n=1 Tax=Archangium violaceum TaxID=83451 RepID=UPI0037C18FF9
MGCKETKKQLSSDIKNSLERWQQQQYWLLVKWGRAQAVAGKKAHINNLPATLRM